MTSYSQELHIIKYPYNVGLVTSQRTPNMSPVINNKILHRFTSSCQVSSKLNEPRNLFAYRLIFCARDGLGVIEKICNTRTFICYQVFDTLSLHCVRMSLRVISERKLKNKKNYVPKTSKEYIRRAFSRI